nr:antirestriction protein ArdA [Luteibacter sp.]
MACGLNESSGRPATQSGGGVDSCEVPSTEEWAVHDYDGIPATFGEYPDLDDILEFVKGVEEHGDAFRAWVEHQGVTNFIHEDFQDKYAGKADSKREWGGNFIDDLGILKDVPENLRPYFDEEQYVRDMELNGDIALVEFDGTVYAFWC